MNTRYSDNIEQCLRCDKILINPDKFTIHDIINCPYDIIFNGYNYKTIDNSIITYDKNICCDECFTIMYLTQYDNIYIKKIVNNNLVIAVDEKKVTRTKGTNIVLGDKSFKNKNAVKQYVSNYLKTNDNINSDDMPFILSLIKYHPEWDIHKTNMQGIKIKFQFKNNWCFRITNAKGGKRDMSYIKCLKNI
jgi:hypothetical protein